MCTYARICVLGFVPILIGLKQGAQYIRDARPEAYATFCLNYCSLLESTEWIWTCNGQFTYLKTEYHDDDNDDDTEDNRSSAMSHP